jgi:hypothetical protein
MKTFFIIAKSVDNIFYVFPSASGRLGLLASDRNKDKYTEEESKNFLLSRKEALRLLPIAIGKYYDCKVYLQVA